MSKLPAIALDWSNANNATLSLRHIAELVRREEARVVPGGVDATGKLILRIELPGSKTMNRPRPVR